MLHRLNEAISAPVAAAINGVTGLCAFSVGTITTSEIAEIAGATSALVSVSYLIWKWRKEWLRDRERRNTDAR